MSESDVDRFRKISSLDKEEWLQVAIVSPSLGV